MATPVCYEDVTKAWLEEVLVEFLDKDQGEITVKFLEYEKEFKGFIANCFKAKVSLEPDSESDENDLDLFVKVGPAKDQDIYDFAKKYELEAIEVNAFKEIWPALIEFEKQRLGQSQLEELIPKMFAAKVEKGRGSYIVMEDLEKSGHVMLTDPDKLTLDHMRLFVRKTAVFHAIGFAYGQEHGLDDIQTSVWPKYIADEGSGLTANIEALIQDVAKDDPDSSLIPCLKSWSKPDPSKSAVDCFGSRHDFLVHGDLWANNVMFKENDDGLTCKFLDFQQLGRGNPSFDFARLLYDNPLSIETIEAWLPELYDEYYRSLSKTLNDFGHQKIPFTKEDFIKDVESKGLFLTTTSDMVLYTYFRDNSPESYKRKVIGVAEKAAKNDPGLFNHHQQSQNAIRAKRLPTPWLCC